MISIITPTEEKEKVLSNDIGENTIVERLSMDDQTEHEYYDEFSFRNNIIWINVLTKTTTDSGSRALLANIDWLCKYLKACNLPQPNICIAGEMKIQATVIIPANVKECILGGTVTMKGMVNPIVDIVGSKVKTQWEIYTKESLEMTHNTDDVTLIKVNNEFDAKYVFVMTLSKILKTDIFKNILDETINI